MISDILRTVMDILAGPTDANESCKTLQNVLACTERKEDDIAHGRAIWEGKETCEKVKEMIEDCISSIAGGK